MENERLSKQDMLQCIQDQMFESLNQFMGFKLDQYNLYAIQATLNNYFAQLYEEGTIDTVPNLCIKQNEIDPSQVVVKCYDEYGKEQELKYFFDNHLLPYKYNV